MKRIFLILVALVVISGPVAAQDEATAEPTVEVVATEIPVEATVAPEPTTIVIVQPDPEDGGDLDDTPEGKGWLRGFISIIGGFAAGVFATLTGGAVLARNTRQDKVIMSFIEKLYASSPANVQTLGKQAASGLQEITEFAQELTDGVDVSSKSVTITAHSDPSRG